jgi:alpha-1,6-mannosyltransferase
MDVDPQPFPLVPTALLGAAGSVFLTLSTLLPDSPFGPYAARLWPLAGTGSPPGWEGPKIGGWAQLADQAPGEGAGHLLPTVLVVLGVVFLTAAWVIVWRAARTHLIPNLKRLWWVVGAWVAPLLLASPFASQDVWHYGAEGKMVLEGFGGYRPASLLGHSVWTLGVDNKWASRPPLYGPGALDLSAFFVKISGGRPWVAAECWRVTALIGLALGAWGVRRIVSLRGGNPTTAMLVAVASPGILIILVGGVHNDALMMGLTVAGVALAQSRKPVPGALLIALGVAVKPNALLALGAVVWWAWGTQWRQRTVGLLFSSLSLGGVLGLTGLGVGGGFGWFTALLSYRWVPGPWSGSRFLGAGTGWPVEAIEILGAVAAILVVIDRRRTGEWIVGLGWGFTLLAVTTPTPEPWYLVWALVFLACGGLHRRSERIGVLVLAVMMVGSAIPPDPFWWYAGVIVLGWLGAIALRARFGSSGTGVSAAPLQLDNACASPKRAP